jgi:hypothetical protein
VVDDLAAKLGKNVATMVRLVDPVDERWGVTEEPLGDVLQRLAQAFASRAYWWQRNRIRLPTARQHAEQMKVALAKVAEAHDALTKFAVPTYPVYLSAPAHPYVHSIEEWRADTASLNAAYGALTDLVPRLERIKQRSDRLVVGKDGRRDSAVALHVEHWRALKKVWRAIPGVEHQPRRFRTFLMICSKPLFPAAVTEGALVAFTEPRSLRPRRRPRHIRR